MRPRYERFPEATVTLAALRRSGRAVVFRQPSRRLPPKEPAMAESPAPAEKKSVGARIYENVELAVVIFLGIVSVATAFTSFQSGLYHGQSDDKVSQSEAAGTLAESLYLEGNQQYVQDAETVLRLAELNVEAQSADPITAADAIAKYDEIYFVGVTSDLDAAIQWAADLDESEPEFYHYPLDDDSYLDARFGAYDEQVALSDDLRAEGDRLGEAGDQLGFYTTLMAITLFLLGIAAVVRNLRMRWVLIAIGMSIFVVTAILTSTIPFTWI
jgi:hypothetical protein